MRVKNGYLRNEQGFTFLESIFQLMIFILFANISLLLIFWFRDIINLDKMKDEVNWELFIYDLNQYNARSVTGMLNSSSSLQMELLDAEDGKYFVFDRSELHIRKRSNLGGNEILLPYVGSWNLLVDNNEILVKVVMRDGTRRERRMVLPVAKE
ncbi:competence type IV pilus minor pilin ComGF [Solibacillus sp. FSL K6-1523]|uniref:competence type IV pilus minor pilin ComGF n=1 Tax=Solibacillus sp. FSL K6-1523 TaxID=2921471 RepID=UPI0030F6002D